MPNVKDLLQKYGPVDFEVCSIGPLENFPKKDGGTYEAHEVKIKTRANSEIYTVRMFPNTVDAGLINGSLVRGSLNDRGYPSFDILPSGPASAGISQVRNNTQQVAVERKMKEDSDDYDTKERAHDWKLGIAGLLQAYITKGEDRNSARTKAIEDAKWIRETALLLASNENYVWYPEKTEASDLPF